MLVTKQPILRRFWYALMPLQMLDDGPKPFTLLGEQLVVWKTATGLPVAMRDRCCHRTAKLSKGYVENDHIVAQAGVNVAGVCDVPKHPWRT